MKILPLLEVLQQQLTGPSASTKLARFAKELEAHGFEAEVKSTSKVGVINRSKLCIVVKGYGMKDELKLYKPLYKWEADATEFVDVKHERRFATVKEMVDELKEFYARLPKCLSYVPPPIKESYSSTRSIEIASRDPNSMSYKKRILQLQQDLIELCDDVSPLQQKPLESTLNGAQLTRYVFQIELNEASIPWLVTLDDIGEDLFVIGVYKSKTDDEVTMTQLNRLSNLTTLFSHDEGLTGMQTGLDRLVDWLKMKAKLNEEISPYKQTLFKLQQDLLETGFETVAIKATPDADIKKAAEHDPDAPLMEKHCFICDGWQVMFFYSRHSDKQPRFYTLRENQYYKTAEELYSYLSAAKAIEDEADAN